MCDVCQLQFRFDHEGLASEGMVPCPKCGRFYIPAENESCYHCFAAVELNETCDLCALDGAKRVVALN